MTDEEFNREATLCQGDGTDALLTALYGESSAATIGKAIGGSQARMLFDAAAEITRLRAMVDSLAVQRNGGDVQQERIEAIQDDTDYTTEED